MFFFLFGLNKTREIHEVIIRDEQYEKEENEIKTNEGGDCNNTAQNTTFLEMQ